MKKHIRRPAAGWHPRASLPAPLPRAAPKGPVLLGAAGVPLRWLYHGILPMLGYMRMQKNMFFPTCQVRVVRFYVSCLVLLLLVLVLSSSSSSSSSNCDPRSTVCSLPDLNHDHPRPVFPAGPQPRPSPPSVPCRTSTTTIHAQCSLPDLNREYPRPVFPAGPQPRPSTPSVPCRTSTASIHAKRYAT